VTLFDLVAARDNVALKEALASDPSAGAARNGEGASLFAFAAYAGNAEASRLIRAALPALDPYEAIIAGDAAAVRGFLAAGWDGNALSPDGFTPLGLATFFKRREIFDLLLPLTRDVNERARNSQQVAALHAAAAMRLVPPVELLLRAGADPNLPQQRGFVPLHTAAMHGDAIIAGLLLLFGADPHRPDADGTTPAAYARQSGHNWLAAQLEARA
jgi:ankyrin repeat protein